MRSVNSRESHVTHVEKLSRMSQDTGRHIMFNKVHILSFIIGFKINNLLFIERYVGKLPV